jgi:hypothetical protein
MANHAYASVWLRDFSEATLIERLGQFLATVPFSVSHPGFTELVIRAVSPAEPPVLERDLCGVPADVSTVVELAGDYVHSDSAYETQAFWDLWVYDAASGGWLLRPQLLEVYCYGEDYDEGVARENGHLQVDVGFEHLFTGHAGLLGFRRQPAAPPQHPAEADFLAAMSWPENLSAYQEKTRANIRKLFDWMQRAESVMPVERYRLWSEGEENFESRLEEILAVR